MYELVFVNAGSSAKYQKKIRRSQLRIAYTILYSIGLRINELRNCQIEDIRKAIDQETLNVTLYKTNRSQNYVLSPSAVKSLQGLKEEFDYLQNEKKFVFLFGKTKPIHSKTLIRIVNQDLATTCNLCQISENISSHSFRIGVISRLLRVCDLHTVASIIGHADIRSTQGYDRYKLSKGDIQEIQSKVETIQSFTKK